MRTLRTLTLVVPCFNEEAVLPEFVRRVRLLAEHIAPIALDVVFVDDASKDGTGELLRGLALEDPRFKVLSLARNSGHQIACTAGLDFADGDAVVIIDADLQDPPEVIPQMLELIAEGYDVVHAQRQQREGESAFKLATARLFYSALARLSRTRIIEDCGDFRALSAQAAEAARHFREPHRFLRGLFAMLGFRQCVFRFKRHERFAGNTKYTVRKMARLATDALFSFSSTPVRAILWMAASLWTLSLAYLGVNLYLWAAGKTVAGWTSIIFLMTFYTGLILASIAVIGAYVGRIFEQGQNRPLYWLADARNIALDHPLRGGHEPREVRLSRAVVALRNELSPRAAGPLVEPKLPVFTARPSAPPLPVAPPQAPREAAP